MKKIFLIFFFCSVLTSSLHASDIRLLFFFSATCPHCREVMPYVEGLSKRFPIEGLLYGKEDWQDLPFPVMRGDREFRQRYRVRGVPAIVILEDGRPRMRIQGARDIKDTEFFIKAFSQKAMTPSEVMAGLEEAEYIITGWLIHRGEYFKDGGFFITDREKDIPVKPWLPLEAIKSPFKKDRPRVMSDVINKPVVLKGRLLKKGSGYSFIVTEEVN